MQIIGLYYFLSKIIDGVHIIMTIALESAELETHSNTHTQRERKTRIGRQVGMVRSFK